MESQSDNERLLELLYGELSAEEAQRLRGEIREDDELAEAWRELQATHREVADFVPEPEPMPEGVRETILESARRSRGDDSERRATAKEPGRGLWGQMASTGWGRAGVSVALMMVVGGAVYYTLIGQEMEVEHQVESVAVEEAAPAPEGAVEEAEETMVEPGGVEEAEEMAGELAEGRSREGQQMAEQIEEEPSEPVGREEPAAAPAPEPEPSAEADSSVGDEADDQIALDGFGRAAGGSAGGDGGSEADDGDVVAEGRGEVDEIEDVEIGGTAGEVDDADESDEGETLLASAREAREDGDYDEAGELIEELLEGGYVDDLDDEELREVRRIRREVEQQQDDGSADTSDDINIMR